MKNLQDRLSLLFSQVNILERLQYESCTQLPIDVLRTFSNNSAAIFELCQCGLR